MALPFIHLQLIFHKQIVLIVEISVSFSRVVV